MGAAKRRRKYCADHNLPSIEEQARVRDEERRLQREREYQERLRRPETQRMLRFLTAMSAMAMGANIRR